MQTLQGKARGQISAPQGPGMPAAPGPHKMPQQDIANPELAAASAWEAC